MRLLSFLWLQEAARLLADAQNGGGSLGGAQRTRQTATARPFLAGFPTNSNPPSEKGSGSPEAARSQPERG